MCKWIQGSVASSSDVDRSANFGVNVVHFYPSLEPPSFKHSQSYMAINSPSLPDQYHSFSPYLQVEVTSTASEFQAPQAKRQQGTHLPLGCPGADMASIPAYTTAMLAPRTLLQTTLQKMQSPSSFQTKQGKSGSVKALCNQVV